jgi:cbb3-type cytochrome oxidase maturation protein
MLVIFFLIFVSLTLGLGFLVAFIWAVESGQFEDTCTPSMRMLTDQDTPGSSLPTNSTTPKN